MNFEQNGSCDQKRYYSNISKIILSDFYSRMVRELFEMARTKKACLIFFDEIDAVGGARFDDGAGGDNEVQRTMLELINQLGMYTNFIWKIMCQL